MCFTLLSCPFKISGMGLKDHLHFQFKNVPCTIHTSMCVQIYLLYMFLHSFWMQLSLYLPLLPIKRKVCKINKNPKNTAISESLFPFKLLSFILAEPIIAI